MGFVESMTTHEWDKKTNVPYFRTKYSEGRENRVYGYILDNGEYCREYQEAWKKFYGV